MSRRRKERQRHARFIALEHGMMNSPAYQALTGDSLKLLLAVWKRHDGQNNGEISFSTREAADLLRGNKNTAARRFAELQELGFLAAEQKGAFSVKLKRATLWRLTCEPSKGQPPTRDYQHWRPAPTVSPRDTNGIRHRYREPQKPSNKVVSVSPRDTVNGHFDPSTVSPRGTHIELAIGSAPLEAPAPAKAQRPRSTERSGARARQGQGGEAPAGGPE